jgi:transposase
MPQKAYHVQLSDGQETELERMLAAGNARGRELTRARILLKAHRGWKDEAIRRALDVSVPTIERVRKRYVQGGLETAVKQKRADRLYETALDGRAEAHLVALVCGPPLEGRKRWSLRVLAEKLVSLDDVELKSVSHETIRRTLKKMNLSPGKRNNG